MIMPKHREELEAMPPKKLEMWLHKAKWRLSELRGSGQFDGAASLRDSINIAEQILNRRNKG